MFLPPILECQCASSVNGAATMGGAAGDRIDFDPMTPAQWPDEILQAGHSQLQTTMRVFMDPTFSIRVDENVFLPKLVQRFYIEVSTVFVKNHITIKQCEAAADVADFNTTRALRFVDNFCGQPGFDLRYSKNPDWMTNMDRISVQKFKFQTGNTVCIGTDETGQ